MDQDFKINERGEIIRVKQVETKKTNWWAVVSLILFFTLCILSYALYESYERIDYLYWQQSISDNKILDVNADLLAKEMEISILQEECAVLQAKEQEIITIQEELSLIREDGFGIHSIEFGNHDYYGNTLTGYGRPLYSSKMKYLKPRIIYYATETKNIVFQYKIFYPNGTLCYNSDYSEEFTGDSHHVTLYAGKKNKVELGGWGNSKESIYQSGTYSIEIWYNGRCVKKQSFEILK